MSRSVLEAIGSTVAIDGVPWLPPGERREIGINSLTAKILCRRHNSALSVLDRAAGEFFVKLRAIHLDAQRRSLSRKCSFILMSGEALELWMLKAACGIFYSKNATSDGTRLINDHSLNEKFMHDAFFSGLWANGCGLYMRASRARTIHVENAVSIALLTALNEQQVVGAQLIITGLEFALIFDQVGVDKDYIAMGGWIQRPSELLFESGTRTYLMGLTWLPGTPPRSIRMTYNRAVGRRSSSVVRKKDPRR